MTDPDIIRKYLLDSIKGIIDTLSIEDLQYIRTLLQDTYRD